MNRFFFFLSALLWPLLLSAQQLILNPTFQGTAQSSLNMGGNALTNVALNTYTTNLNGQAFVFEGDSITAGAYLSTPSTQCFGYLFSQMSFAKNHGTYFNDSVTGSTIATITSRYAANVKPYRPSANGGSGGPRAFLFVLIGTNDLAVSGLTSAQVITALTTYVTTAQGDGFTVVLGTITPRTASWNSTLEGYRNAVNTAIRAGAGQTSGSSTVVPSNMVVDFAAQLPDPTNSLFAYYYSDGLHWSAAGHQAIATYLNNALTANGALTSPLQACFESPALFNNKFTLSALNGYLFANGTNAVSASTTLPTSALSGVLSVTNGGTGTSTPGLVAGTNVTVTGTWPNQTINASGGGGGGTVTSFSAGNLSPLFTTSVANSTTTPALSFSLSNAAQNSVLAGPSSGGAGAPSYQTTPTFSGANITGINAANVTTGTLPNAQLGSNVPLLNGTNAFTGFNSVAPITLTTTNGPGWYRLIPIGYGGARLPSLFEIQAYANGGTSLNGLMEFSVLADGYNGGTPNDIAFLHASVAPGYAGQCIDQIAVENNGAGGAYLDLHVNTSGTNNATINFFQYGPAQTYSLSFNPSYTNRQTFAVPSGAEFSNFTVTGQYNGSGAGLTNVPASSLTGTVAAAAMPALTGDVTTTTGTVATTVGKINGTSLAGLASGLLYNTTSTGVPSIATANQVAAAFTGTTGTVNLGSSTLTLPSSATVGSNTFNFFTPVVANLTGQTGALSSILTTTPSGLGTYQITGYLYINSSTSTTINAKVNYTDENSNVHTVLLTFMTTSGTFSQGPGSAAGLYGIAPLTFRANASAITVSSAFATGSTMNYDLGINLIRLN